MKVVDYEKQVVAGFNHKLTFEGKDGRKKTVIVYENIEGKMQVVSNQ